MNFLGHECLPSAAQKHLSLDSRRDIFVMIQEDTITAAHTNHNYSSHFSGMPMLVCLVNFKSGKTKNACFGLRKEIAIIEV